MGFKQHISRTWQMIEQQVNDVPFRPHNEAANRLNQARRAQMKSGAANARDAREASIMRS